MQQLIISGIIGKDAVLRNTSSDGVAGFSVAVDNGKDKQGNKRETTWFDCSLWGKRGEGLCQYLTKGSRVTIMGRPTARAHEGKVYMGVSVNEISLLGGGQKSQGQNSRGDYQSNQDAGSGEPSGNFDLDDDIPF